jgi:BirA family biotin operon repressor/biotin-[acetyl-CoA-carboxylase] ligase
VVGIGVNVNHRLEDFPPELRDRATSLAMALGNKVNRYSFAAALLRELDQTHATLDLPTHSAADIRL